MKNQHRKHKLAHSSYHISRVLRTRVHNVLKGYKKSASTLTLLGCSVPQLVKHLESANKITQEHIDSLINVKTK